MLRVYSLMVIMFFVLVPHSLGQTHNNPIEIFDIGKGRIVQTVPGSKKIEGEIGVIVESITDLYRAFEPIPHNGYMIKIPLEEAIKIENEWLHSLVSEVILIFPEYENPHLMVVDDENRPYFFSFEKSVDGVLDELKFNPAPRPKRQA